MMPKKKRKSMFDEKREFIIQKLNEGHRIKDVFCMIDNNQGFYQFDAFYYYVKVVLGYRQIYADCEHCGNIIWAYCPSSIKNKPVCLVRHRIMRTDFKDRPLRCSNYVTESEGIQKWLKEG